MSSPATTPRPATILDVAARTRAATLLDAAIAAATLAGSFALLSRHGIGSLQAGPGELDWVSGVLAVCSTVPLLAWRRGPRAVFLVTASATVMMAALGYSIGLPLGPTVALYLFAASRDDADPWTRRSTATAIVLLVAYVAATTINDGRFPDTEFLHTTLAWGAAWFAGERTRLQREQIAQLEGRAHRAERDAERDRRLAVAEERARIARDLHDSAGHAINVIAVRAGAARMRHDEDPERSRVALQAIEDVARQTADDIDQIVGSLRDQGSVDEEIASPPGLSSLQSLIEHRSEGGLDVTVTTSGAPRQLGAVVDLAVFRILQEALTNAARHGTGAAQIDLAFGDSEIRLTITNPVPDGAAPPNGGHGLIGMRERATLLDGLVDTDRTNGTFCLRAKLPYGAPQP